MKQNFNLVDKISLVSFLSQNHIPLCIHASGNLCLRVFANQLIVINKYVWIFSETKQIKVIKVTYTDMKQVNKRMFCMNDIKTNRNQVISKKTALILSHLNGNTWNTVKIQS